MQISAESPKQPRDGFWDKSATQESQTLSRSHFQRVPVCCHNIVCVYVLPRVARPVRGATVYKVKPIWTTAEAVLDDRLERPNAPTFRPVSYTHLTLPTKA